MSSEEELSQWIQALCRAAMEAVSVPRPLLSWVPFRLVVSLLSLSRFQYHHRARSFAFPVDCYSRRTKWASGGVEEGGGEGVGGAWHSVTTACCVFCTAPSSHLHGLPTAAAHPVRGLVRRVHPAGDQLRGHRGQRGRRGQLPAPLLHHREPRPLQRWSQSYTLKSVKTTDKW